MYSVGGRSDNSDSDRAERAANDAKALTAKKRLLALVDALIELDSATAPTPPSATESDSLFREIDTWLTRALLPQQFRGVVIPDVTESQVAYRAEAYKACVVMLGAALEGLMLGIRQRTDVLVHLAKMGAAAPGPIRQLGTGDPALADKIGNELTFDDYKVCIHHLIEGSDDLGVDNIQSFRNAIHPWKAIQEPLKYASIDSARPALHRVLQEDCGGARPMEALVRFRPATISPLADVWDGRRDRAGNATGHLAAR